MSTEQEQEALVAAYLEEHGHHADARHGFLAGLAAGFHRSMASDSSVETWVCGKCGGDAYEHSLTTSTCIWEPIETRPAPQAEPSSEVPEPSTECPQCHRPDGLHKLGCGERFGSEPQGEPSSAQVNRDYLAQVIHKAVYSRIPLDDLTDEAQADTYKRADAVVAALRAAGGVR